MAASTSFRSKNGRFLTKRECLKRYTISKVPKKKTNQTPSISESCRRIVDLNLLAEMLWCETCLVPLTLRLRQDEKMSGLNSTFKVPCNSCENLKMVKTSKDYFGNNERGRRLYDVNMKVVLGMIDAGIGAHQLNALLSAINLPEMTEPLIKRHERLVGPAIEQVAKDSCLAMAKLERDLAIDYPIKEFKTIEDRHLVDELIEERIPRPSVICRHVSSQVTRTSAASTLSILKGQISAIMIGKIAAANLKLEDMQRVYNNGGEDSLFILFSESCNGRPRVTKCKKVVAKIVSVLENGCT